MLKKIKKKLIGPKSTFRESEYARSKVGQSISKSLIPRLVSGAKKAATAKGAMERGAFKGATMGVKKILKKKKRSFQLYE